MSNCGPSARIYRPRGIYEGGFASRAPYAIGSYENGPDPLVMGRFGWVANDQVSNVQTDGASLGFVIPRFGLWSLVYCQNGVWYLRPGKPVSVATKGDFWVRFPEGANIGAQVYADPATGIAYAADGGGFAWTGWQVITDTHAGGLAIISPYAYYA